MKNIWKDLRPKGNKSESHDTGADTPEANVARAIKAFCEAGKGQGGAAPGPEGIDSNNMDEVTFLPTIVEYAESSPTAAKEALYTIRKQLDMKNVKQGYQQYNALMLLRILVDNPGPTFTRNVDAKFVSAVKELYRGVRDPSVRQLLVENLEYFERKDDAGLQPIKEWYVKEKKGGDFGLRSYPPIPNVGGYPVHGQPYSGRSQRRPKNVLPPPEELAARISEAQTSAKLLMQILQSTPTAEVLSNQLITEFADRCSAASRSIQQFIEADSPGPDESTMLTLFETNEQLATSLSRHQMAIFSAKQQLKQQGGGVDGSNPTSRTPSGTQVPTLSTPIPPSLQTGLSPSPPHPGLTGSPVHETVNYRTSPSPPIPQQRSLFAPPPPPIPPQPQPVTQQQQYPTAQAENPFNDPEPQTYQQPAGFNTAPYTNWRPEPQGFGNPSPITPGQEGGQGGHHPMADVSPVAPPPQPQGVPHGYQPYRY